MIWLSMGLKPDGPASPLRPALCTLNADTRLTWDGPNGGPSEHQEFVGAAWDNGLLLQCTRTQVLWIRLGPTPEVVRVLDHPLFYDLHHAIRLPDGRLAVAASGHDSILFFEDDRLSEHVWLRGPRTSFAKAYGGVTDFRQQEVARFKPHTHHPNHLCWTDDALWVTELHSRGVRNLTTGKLQVLPGEGVHDGLRIGDHCWYTTIEGQLLAVHHKTRTLDARWQVRDAEGWQGHAGWCRGVWVEGHTAWVGFTVLRDARWKEYLREAVRGTQATKAPTRVIQLNLLDSTVERVIPVGNASGGTLYGLHRAISDEGPAPATPVLG